MAEMTGAFLESLKTRHSVIVGATRSGKTYFVGQVLTRLQGEGVHTIFVDPKWDKDYETLGIVCTTPMQVYANLLAKKPKIIFRTNIDTKEEDLNLVIRLLFDLQRTDGYKRIRRVIAIDEVQLYVGKGKNTAIEMIWTIGAGLKIVGIALTQRVQLLNETCWSQSENKVLFRMDERAEYLKQRALEHYPLDDLNLDMRKYHYYATSGGGKWKLYDPIDTPKYSGPLKLTRW
jgi:hypothetical protein